MVYIPNHIVEKLDAVNVYDVAEKLGIAVSRNLAQLQISVAYFCSIGLYFLV